MAYWRFVEHISCKKIEKKMKLLELLRNPDGDLPFATSVNEATVLQCLLEMHLESDAPRFSFALLAQGPLLCPVRSRKVE